MFSRYSVDNFPPVLAASLLEGWAMSYLNDLYQEVILDHNRQPRNFGELAHANRRVEGFNPLCGDRIKLFLKLENDRIVEVSFTGAGCAISTASASLMTEALKGKSVADADALFQRFHHLVTRQPDEEAAAELGKLAVFQGVCEYPVRIKCATLPWHTLLAALRNSDETVSTE
jgi:nitrogen fixation protein NifU and related proteins